MRFFVGGYTAESEGQATGIGVLHAGEPDSRLAGGELAVVGEAVAAGGSPSWLAWHPSLDVIYAACEGAGNVRAFRRTGEDTFAAFGPAVAAGDAVCHVEVSPSGRWLVASCWGDGRVVRMRLDEHGMPASPSIAPAAEDPHRDAYADAGMLLDAGRSDESDNATQRPSRVHQARFVPGGPLVTTDLGLDLVRVWGNSEAGLTPLQTVVLPRGSGPRHTVWHPSGHLYVVTELSLEVFVLAPDTTGRWRIVGAAPASPQGGADFAAEIALSRDAESVYVGLRGSNTIATLRVRSAGEQLASVALSESGADWPRHHVVAGTTLLVAGQRSHEIVSLPLDPRTGVPGRAQRRAAAASPSHLLADRG